MQNFFQKIAAFMQGRYGMDSLNVFLLALDFILWFVNHFIFFRTAHLIIMLIEFGLFGWFIFRVLSRNITMRSKENRSFCKIYEPAKKRVQLLWRQFRERDTYRYLKCPSCKAQLRVRAIKGKHNVRCPKCGSEFEKNI